MNRNTQRREKHEVERQSGQLDRDGRHRAARTPCKSQAGLLVGDADIAAADAAEHVAHGRELLRRDAAASGFTAPEHDRAHGGRVVRATVATGGGGARADADEVGHRIARQHAHPTPVIVLTSDETGDDTAAIRAPACTAFEALFH